MASTLPAWRAGHRGVVQGHGLPDGPGQRGLEGLRVLLPGDFPIHFPDRAGDGTLFPLENPGQGLTLDLRRLLKD